MAALRELGCEVFVEVGPEPTLIKMGRQCVSDARDLAWVSSMDRKEDAPASFEKAVEVVKAMQGPAARPPATLEDLQLFTRQPFTWAKPTALLSWQKSRRERAASMRGDRRRLTPQEVMEIVIGCLSRQLNTIPEITSETLVMDLQMDSLTAVAFAAELSAQLEGTGVALPADFLYSHPRVGDMISDIVAMSGPGGDLKGIGLVSPVGGGQLSPDDAPRARGLKSNGYQAVPELDNLPVGREARRHSWGMCGLYLLAILYISAILLLPGWFVLSRAFDYGLRYPHLPVILVVAPVGKLVFNLLLLLLIVLSKALIFGNLKPGEKIPLASVRFVEYWTLTRLMSFANILVLGELKRTKLLNIYYRLLGARIGNDVIIDTLGVTDPDTLTVHDGAVLGNGALMLGHTIREGVISFGNIAVGRHATVEPRAILQPEAKVDHYSVVPALAGVGRNQMAGMGKSPHADPPGDDSARARRALLETLGHVAGLYIVYAAASVSLVGMKYLSHDGASEHGTLIGLSCALAVLQLMSGIYLPFLPLFIGGNRFGLENMLLVVLKRWHIIGALWVFPVFYLGYSIMLIALTTLLKWLLIGRWEPGLVPERGFLGWRKWVSDLLLEYCYRQSVSLRQHVAEPAGGQDRVARVPAHQQRRARPSRDLPGPRPAGRGGRRPHRRPRGGGDGPHAGLGGRAADPLRAREGRQARAGGPGVGGDGGRHRARPRRRGGHVQGLAGRQAGARHGLHGQPAAEGALSHAAGGAGGPAVQRAGVVPVLHGAAAAAPADFAGGGAGGLLRGAVPGDALLDQRPRRRGAHLLALRLHRLRRAAHHHRGDTQVDHAGPAFALPALPDLRGPLLHVERGADGAVHRAPAVHGDPAGVSLLQHLPVLPGGAGGHGRVHRGHVHARLRPGQHRRAKRGGAARAAQRAQLRGAVPDAAEGRDWAQLRVDAHVGDPAGVHHGEWRHPRVPQRGAQGDGART
jgi:hypothetical protein